MTTKEGAAPQARRVAKWVAIVAGGLVLVLAAYGGWIYYSLSSGIRRSHALPQSGVASSPRGELNLLLMGLDSRLDENGKALPAKIYGQLHAGDSGSGGENANVLILLHLPAKGPGVAISIPRDDYTAFPNCPDGQCHGKIKQAYGLAFDAKARELARAANAPHGAARVQQERDAGRAAEAATVSQFLGGVPIDHFIEVTMVAFYQLAQVVQPITVCVAENTTDSYSGAHFRQGVQQINAAQAVAFVRQRRDTTNPALNFTDLDRSRRQQAFISSLAAQLKQTSTFIDPTKLTRLISIAKRNIAIDSSLDLLSFAGDAQRLAGGRLTFYTLPVARFGRAPDGEDVNFVDLPTIQSTVARLFHPAPAATPASAPATPAPAASPVVVTVINATGRTHLAATVTARLAHEGYRTATPTTTVRHAHTLIRYGANARAAATALAGGLGSPATALDGALPADSVEVVLGADFAGAGAAPATATATLAPVNAEITPGQVHATYPAVTQLSSLAGGGVRCVK